MRTSILLMFLFSFACADKKTEKKAIVYYVIGSTSKNSQATTHSLKNEQADIADYLITQDIFTYKKKQHIIMVYTSDNHADVDNGHLYYTLDSLGVIYKRSTTWPGFGRLSSNNDSINDLINQTFVFILQKPQLHCYTHRREDSSSRSFVPPIIKEE